MYPTPEGFGPLVPTSTGYYDKRHPGQHFEVLNPQGNPPRKLGPCAQRPQWMSLCRSTSRRSSPTAPIRSTPARSCSWLYGKHRWPFHVCHTLPMPVMHIQHRIGDLDTWLQDFARPCARAKAAWRYRGARPSSRGRSAVHRGTCLLRHGRRRKKIPDVPARTGVVIVVAGTGQQSARRHPPRAGNR